MAKGKRNRRRREQKARPAGPAADKSTAARNEAELRGQLREILEPKHDPAGVLSARQMNPPRVVGYVPPELTQAILDEG